MINLIAKSNFDKLDKLKKEKLNKSQIKEAHTSAKNKLKTQTQTKENVR